MASAGLTRGGFYSYFGSKSELYALAVGNLFAEAPPSRPESSGSDAALQLIRAYLSERPADNLGACWSLVSPPSDLAHGDPTVRRVFETVFNSMVALFEQSLEREGRPDRDRALVMATLCVGAMVIARALDGSHLAGQVRATALHQALQLGRALKRKPGQKGSTVIGHDRDTVPMLDDLAVLEAKEMKVFHTDSSARRRYTEQLSAVSGGRSVPHSDIVAFGHHVMNGRLNFRER